jgi:hypothetical protein
MFPNSRGGLLFPEAYQSVYEINSGQNRLNSYDLLLSDRLGTGAHQQTHSFNPALFSTTGIGVVPASIPLPITLNAAQGARYDFIPTHFTIHGTTLINQSVPHASFAPCDRSSAQFVPISLSRETQVGNYVGTTTNTALTASKTVSNPASHHLLDDTKLQSTLAGASPAALKPNSKTKRRQPQQRAGTKIWANNALAEYPSCTLVDTRRENDKEKKRQNRGASSGLVKAV